MDEITPGMLAPVMMPSDDSRTADMEAAVRDVNQSVESVSGRVSDIERYFSGFQEHDVALATPDGTPIGLRIIGKVSGQSVVLPAFNATGSKGAIKSVGPGYYKIGATGAFTKLDETKGSGTNAYLVITSNWGGTPTVKVEISGAQKEVEFSGALPYDATISRIPIARIQNNQIEQLFSGNAIITIWAIDGAAAYWAEPMGGKEPAR